MTYVLNEYGEVVKTDQVFSGGRFRMIDGKMVRVGDSRAIPDRPYSTKSAFDNPVFCHADGKHYSNASDYESAVKRAGCTILGEDAPRKAAPPKKSSVNWEKAVAETMKNIPLKGKKR